MNSSPPGWGRRFAQDALAETGADMTRFRAGADLASWVGRTPLDSQSGARNGRARHKKGNRYLAAITGETAAAAGKTQTRGGAEPHPPHQRFTRFPGQVMERIVLLVWCTGSAAVLVRASVGIFAGESALGYPPLERSA